MFQSLVERRITTLLSEEAVVTAERVICSAGRKLCCLCIVLVTLALAGPARAKPLYTILPSKTTTLSINDSGAITGHYLDGGGYLRTPDGTITSFHAPGDAEGTYGVSINVDDAIAGGYLDESFVSHGFVRSADGVLTTFDAPGAGGGTSPACITALGVVVGWYDDSANAEHGFMRAADGTITAIDVPQATDTQAICADDKGTIAGNYWDQDGAGHGFVRSARGKITTFDVPGDTLATLVYGINSKGAIAGQFVDGSGLGHGYVRSADGTFTTFDAPGANTEPLGINSKGETTGTYDASNGRKRIGFLRKSDGTITSIHVSGASGGTVPVSVNSSGVIAGTSYVQTVNHTLTPSGFIRTP
jgi:hypothetical protein